MKQYERKAGALVRRFVFCIRPFRWFFLRNWYASRWGHDGLFPGEKLYLLDIGAITIGWSFERPANPAHHAPPLGGGSVDGVVGSLNQKGET